MDEDQFGGREELKEGEEPMRSVLLSEPFVKALAVGIVSGGVACVLKHFDPHEDGALGGVLPESVVFNVFIVFASLVAAFRTSHALVRYMEAASLLHKLAACHYDVAGTLLAFCRTSQASSRSIDQFQHTLLRLLSMLNALCLARLENKLTKMEVSHRFEVLGWEELDATIQRSLMMASPLCKVEHVVQMIHQLIVDNIGTGVLNIAPPILTRSFQELGDGVSIYHEAKKLSCVPLPYAYRFLTRTLLVVEALFVAPLSLALYSKDPIGAFIITFGCTYLLWYLNEVADALDNPFKRASSSLNPPRVQHDLNVQLWGLLVQARDPTPCMSDSWFRGHKLKKSNTIRQSLSDCFPATRSDLAYAPALSRRRTASRKLHGAFTRVAMVFRRLAGSKRSNLERREVAARPSLDTSDMARASSSHDSLSFPLGRPATQESETDTISNLATDTGDRRISSSPSAAPSRFSAVSFDMRNVESGGSSCNVTSQRARGSSGKSTSEVSGQHSEVRESVEYPSCGLSSSELAAPELSFRRSTEDRGCDASDRSPRTTPVDTAAASRGAERRQIYAEALGPGRPQDGGGAAALTGHGADSQNATAEEQYASVWDYGNHSITV